MIATIGNLQLNYREIQPEKKSDESLVALFIHEALGSISQWKTFPQELCDKLGLSGIVYERQGHGSSSPFSEERDERYLHRYALEELPAFVEAVVPPSAKLLLIGHSDGGTISLLFDHLFPKRVAGVVTMAAHVINESETIAGIHPAVEAYKRGKLDGLQNYHGNKTNDLFHAWATIWRSPSFANWNIILEIGSDNPGLFIQGEDDQYGTAQQLELIEFRYKNGTTLLLDSCGHHPHLEQKDRVISEIASFFSERIS